MASLIEGTRSLGQSAYLDGDILVTGSVEIEGKYRPAAQHGTLRGHTCVGITGDSRARIIPGNSHYKMAATARSRRSGTNRQAQQSDFSDKLTSVKGAVVAHPEQA